MSHVSCLKYQVFKYPYRSPFRTSIVTVSTRAATSAKMMAYQMPLTPTIAGNSSTAKVSQTNVRLVEMSGQLNERTF